MHAGECRRLREAAQSLHIEAANPIARALARPNELARRVDALDPGAAFRLARTCRLIAHPLCENSGLAEVSDMNGKKENERSDRGPLDRRRAAAPRSPRLRRRARRI